MGIEIYSRVAPEKTKRRTKLECPVIRWKTEKQKKLAKYSQCLRILKSVLHYRQEPTILSCAGGGGGEQRTYRCL